MLEKPALADEMIAGCLEEAYGLDLEEVVFLPLGADPNTAVYRLAAVDGKGYFLKLRSGAFDEASVAVPKYLGDLGLRQVIPCLPTRTGHLWADLGPFKAMLHPYVDGQDGFARKLSERQWVEFGAALRRFHSADIPAAITGNIGREDFSSRRCESVERHLARIERAAFGEPAASELSAFLRTRKDETLALVARAGRCARRLQERPPEFILCHGDIHAWNLLVTEENTFYIVDWDTLVFAPRERDLMFVGGGLGGNRFSPDQEEALFYRGYGPARIDPVALTYYRCERIVEDIAIYCDQILLSDEGGEDRWQSLEYLKSNFLPGGTIEMAYRSGETL